MKRAPWNHKLPKNVIREIKKRANGQNRFEWEIVAQAIEATCSGYRAQPQVSISSGNGVGSKTLFSGHGVFGEDKLIDRPIFNPHGKFKRPIA